MSSIVPVLLAMFVGKADSTGATLKVAGVVLLLLLVLPTYTMLYGIGDYNLKKSLSVEG